MNNNKRLMDFDGAPLPYEPGQSIGAALINAGITSWRTTRKKGKTRGLFCGIGVCYDCLLTVDGQLNQRACVVPAASGAKIETGRRGLSGSAPQDQTDTTIQPEDSND
jgi:predicted molibdopterin-dependent oxidoreductase YjgC